MCVCVQVRVVYAQLASVSSMFMKPFTVHELRE